MRFATRRAVELPPELFDTTKQRRFWCFLVAWDDHHLPLQSDCPIKGVSASIDVRE